MADTSAIDARYEKLVSAWLSKHIETRDMLSAELEEYRVYFAYHSGRIENDAITYHDTREVFENGKAIGFTGDVRTLFEIQNLKECHERMLDAFQEHQAITEAFIREVHEILTKGTYDEARWSKGERPGAYKLGDYVVGVNGVGAPATDVKKRIRALVAELDVASPENVPTVAAYFHLVFEAIHPFADGNGRVGRALMNYLLVLHNHPPIIIYDEDKMAYYGAMEAWDEEADLEPMMNFLKVEAIKTWG